jgi:WD40 repeat protein
VLLNDRPVHVTRFSPNNTEIGSASDDGTVRLWDIPSQTCLQTFDGHTDYVRSLVFNPNNPSLLLSGSYDSTIKLWDARTGNAEMTMSHGSNLSVEDVLLFPTGGSNVALSAGGPILRVWDLAMAGGKCVRALSNHQKTISCMTFDGGARRVLTGGLDMMVKVYDVEDWKVVHTMRYPAPIMSLAVSVSCRLRYCNSRSGLTIYDMNRSRTIHISPRECQTEPSPSDAATPKPRNSLHPTFKTKLLNQAHTSTLPISKTSLVRVT